MRSSKSRSRSKSSRNRSVGNIVNRVFDSSGPEGKVRGTPQQIIDKYNQLARDSQLSNDRVATENFQQHAEHYTRMLGEAQREAEARREQQEAQQRERQRERDEARAANGNGHMSDAQPDMVVDPQGEQPDVIDISSNDPQPETQESLSVVESEGAEPDNGLVETPETAPKPARPRRPRRKTAAQKAKEEAEKAAADEAAAPAADAGESSAEAPAAEPETKSEASSAAAE
ncbi:MAG: DUF4167 domain-containing protein [Mangrovicoccus sp.]